MRTPVVPTPQEAKNQAKLILKAAALKFLKPAFFRVDATDMALEQDAINAAVLDSNETFSDSRSKFGLPVFDDILFEQLMYTDDGGRQVIVYPFSMGTALCEVNQERHIVKTEVAGRNGSVKEYMSDGDFAVNIKGVLVSLYQNVPPKDSVNQLMGFCTAPVEFNVTSNFLAYFGIYTLVIKDYRFSPREGMRNVIDFELMCMSDTPFEIKGSQNTSVPSFI
jgi:hypothetical protein